MSNDIDSLFGIHTQALQLWQRRAEVLASNLVNADTPHYLARDIDFRTALGTATHAKNVALPLVKTAATHLSVAGTETAGGALLYRQPLQPALDGNTVDTQVEQAAFAENEIHYQASLNFINAQISLLRMAITGAS